MAHGSDKSRFVDMDYGGKRYIYIHNTQHIVLQGYCLCAAELWKTRT